MVNLTRVIHNRFLLVLVVLTIPAILFLSDYFLTSSLISDDYLTAIGKPESDSWHSALTDSIRGAANAGLDRVGVTVGKGKSVVGGKGKVLVTGGVGSMGREIVKQLLTDGYQVSIIDLQPVNPQLLWDLLPDHQSKPSNPPASSLDSPIKWYSHSQPQSSILSYHSGDIRESQFISAVLSTQKFDGVINLAAESRAIPCKDHPIECKRTNVNGLANIIFAMDDNKITTPWLIHTSSMDVFGSDTSSFTDSKRPTTILGETKLSADSMLADRYKSKPKTRTMILRPSIVYGSSYDHRNRLVPSTVLNALNDLPIQVLAGNSTQFDFIHIDDVIATYSRAVEYLQSSTRKSGSKNGLWAEINLLSGFRHTTGMMVQIVRGITQSSSPVQLFDRSEVKLGITDGFTPDKQVWELLGYTPSITLTQGLAKYIDLKRQMFLDYGYQYLFDNCPDSQYGNSSVIREEDIRNRRLDLLDGCTVEIGVKNNGYLQFVKCGGSHIEKGNYTDECGINNDKIPTMNWNASIFTVRTMGSVGNEVGVRSGDLDGIEDEDRSSSGSRIRLRFEETLTKRILGFSKDVDEKSGIFNISLIKKGQEAVTEFEARVQHNASYLQLVVAGTENRLRAVPHGKRGKTTNFELFNMDTHKGHPAAGEHDVRLTVICCNSSEPWPLLMDDYETADIQFGTEGQIRFDTSKRMHQCQRIEHAILRNEQLRINFDGLASHDGPDGIPLRDIPLSTLPSDWRLRYLPTCWNDCNNPNICVQTGACRCVHSDECTQDQITATAVGHSSQLTLSAPHEPTEYQRWENVLLPQARTIFRAHPNLIKVHVVTGWFNETNVEALECHKLQSAHCFSADAVLYKAMRIISVPPEEADLIIIPVYENCGGFLLDEITEYAEDTIPGFLDKMVSLVLVHDWGICVNFKWELWSARQSPALKPHPILDNVIAWSVMGDYNSPCYRPEQDIVIPARTCLSKKLVQRFGNLKDVKPARERSSLLTWGGTWWGTGKNARLRLTCPRGGKGAEDMRPGLGPMSALGPGGEYLDKLSDAIFCPQPTGIAGWSFRPNDAIYAGCIPVLMSEGSHFPFADVIDWSKISVRVSPTDLDQIENILLAIPMTAIEEMQKNLLAVREAFMYSTDEAPGEELNRKGPLWFAMQSARIRMSTLYPTNNLY